MTTFLWCLFYLLLGLWLRPLVDAFVVIFKNAYKSYLLDKENNELYNEKHKNDED